MTKRNFIQGALILFSASLIVKIFGFIFQIIIVRYIGTEAIGLYNMVFPLYMTLIVLTTAGLPPAISKMVAEQMAHHNTSGALRILKISLYLLIVLSIIFTVILAFAARSFYIKYFLPRLQSHLVFLCYGSRLINRTYKFWFKRFFSRTTRYGSSRRYPML